MAPDDFVAGMRLMAVLLAALLVLPALPAWDAPSASAAAPARPLRVAVIDSGINASHPEFAPGQVAAWKDFTPENSSVPVDKNGHGTATASLVAGRNAGDCGAGVENDKLSFAPGAQLVIARVIPEGNSVDADLGAAILWALAQDVDVISMSIGATIPFPLGADAAITQARQEGVLFVVSAGNGLGNFGLFPYPGWSTSHGNHRDVLAVGAGSRLGSSLTSTTGNADPDLVSWGDEVCVADFTGGYTAMSGTSFAAPLVAGIAAKAIEAAEAAGKPADPERVERLLLTSARNSNVVPYAREGMGFLLTAQLPTLLAHAQAGTLPDYDAQGPHARADRIYHDNVVEVMRGMQSML